MPARFTVRPAQYPTRERGDADFLALLREFSVPLERVPRWKRQIAQEAVQRAARDLHMRPPQVHWFDDVLHAETGFTGLCRHSERGGYAPPIALWAGLNDTESLVRVVAHEVRHSWQSLTSAFLRSDESERDAEAYATSFITRVLKGV